MINLPEWAVVLTLTGFGVVVWWGVTRLVRANDQTNESLADISQHLAKINGRLGKSEEWQKGHEKIDDERHRQMQTALHELRA